MHIRKSISVELPSGTTADVAVVKELRIDPEPVLIFDLCSEVTQEEGGPILKTLQADCFAAADEAPFELTPEEYEQLAAD